MGKRGSVIRRVAIIVAMRAEGMPLIKRLGLTEVKGPCRLPFRWFDGRVGGLDVRVALNGVDTRHGVDQIATQPATLNAYVTATSFSPDLLLTAGTAGGWRAKGAEIGDVYLSGSPLVFHDRRVPLPGFEEYGHGRYPVVDIAGAASRLRLKTGVVSTSNSLDGSEPDASIMASHGADVKEMEAAAVGWVANTMGVPIVAIKAITDHVDHGADTAEQFTANFSLATERLVDAVERLLEDADGRSLGYLA